MSRVIFSKSHFAPLAIVVALVGGVALGEIAPDFVRSVSADEFIDQGKAMAGIETEPQQIDMSQFVKINNRHYNITFDDSVDMEPTGSATVRKIGYGHEQDVTIAYTRTGTYSTDGFASKNVLYPGVDVEEVHPIFIWGGSFVYLSKKQLNILHDNVLGGTGSIHYFR